MSISSLVSGLETCKQPVCHSVTPALECKVCHVLINVQSAHPCCHDSESLQNAGGRVYIEFGAGKGYLSSMLADASNARDFVLLDVRGFRNKADRCSVTSLSALQPCHWSPNCCAANP